MKRVHVCSTPGCPHLAPCPVHARSHTARWSRDRDGAAQNRFARALRKRSGGTCERCGRAPAEVAHHIKPGYQSDDGLDLCQDCHRMIDKYAR